MLRSPFSSNPQPDPFEHLRIAILNEHLRQAKLEFNLAVAAVVLSLGISLTGAILLISGKTSEGTVTAASGLLSNGLCTQNAKGAKDKLKQITSDINSNRASGN